MKRIILIDDSKVSLKVIQNMLEKKYVVDAFHNSKEALKYIYQIESKVVDTIPDAIITDMIMPNPKGDSIAAFVKSSRLLANVPVIILSAGLKGKGMGDALSSGCDEVVSKPVKSDELHGVLDQLLNTPG